MATDDEILARLIAKGAESRGGASEARAGGMESLQEAMAAGQPTSQDAWTTAIAGALPALLGGLFGGKAGLRAGAEGGLVGAGTSMKLGADERARKEKYGALTAKTKLDQAKELDKDARLYDMEASKGGLQSAMQDERIESSEGIAKMQEGGRWGRHAESIAAQKEANAAREETAAERERRIVTSGLNATFQAKLNSLGIPKQISAASNIRELVKGNTKFTDAQLGNQLVKLSGDVGAIRLEEANRAAAFPLSTQVKQYFQWVAGGQEGNVPEMDRKGLLEIADIYEGVAKNRVLDVRYEMLSQQPLYVDIISNLGTSLTGEARKQRTSKGTKSSITDLSSLEAIAKKRGLVQDDNGKWSLPSKGK